MMLLSVVAEETVHGVMGGGGESGDGKPCQRSHELPMPSLADHVCEEADEGTELEGEATRARVAVWPRFEPVRTSCLKTATGDAEKPMRGDMGETGTGVERPGEPIGGGMAGSW
jgi:hypothetical protein